MYYEVQVLRANVHFSIDENDVRNWWKRGVHSSVDEN